MYVQLMIILKNLEAIASLLSDGLRLGQELSYDYVLDICDQLEFFLKELEKVYNDREDIVIHKSL